MCATQAADIAALASRLRSRSGMRRIVLVSVLVLAAVSSTRADSLRPRIVNGTITNQYPSVGVLLVQEPTGELAMLCSGTLIGCNTVVTAAHCFCPPDPLTGHTPSCTNVDALTADFAGVYFQHAGLFAPARVSLHPEYQFGARADVAIVKLAQPVTGISPSSLNRARQPPSGATGLVVGFGRTGGDPFRNFDYGIKRRAPIETAICPEPVAGIPHLCFSLALPGDGGTCNGDSGGPLFLDFGAGDVLAGITSGGFAYGNCLAPAFNFSTNVFTNRDWIERELGADSLAACGDLAAIGTETVQILGSSGRPDFESDTQRLRYSIPANVGTLRIGLNAEDFGVVGDVPFVQGYNLYAKMNAEPTIADSSCGPKRSDPYKFCEIESPAAGELHLLLERVAGYGQYQITLTLFPLPPGVTPRSSPTPTPTPRNTATAAPTRTTGPCIGDCDRDGRIGISELIRGVGLALRGTAPADCDGIDADSNGLVSVNELVLAVGGALNGCVGQ